ncbi:RNA-binding protein [uncultured Cocleimonas sp.]|uniref:RNA recognition motif domain-containing protein n=1 Tax=uncultured Cocleimonas sp. TaxID=1051587 RepID=UPI0026289BFF|nr:RNA-binding protein [uncultured Cocleimonas sp.]
MYFVFGNLPDRVDEKDIREFLSRFSTVGNVSFLKKSEESNIESTYVKSTYVNNKDSHSHYECLVDLKLVDRIQGIALQQRLNQYCWKGRCIHSYMLLF